MSANAENPDREVVIRAARAGDVESYRACIDRIARARIYVAIVEAYPAAEVQAFVEDMIARDLPLYVAEAEGGRVVGWCNISVPAPRPEREGFAHIGSLAMGVDAAHRGRGIGESLLLAALAHVKRISLERVELQVYSGNAAAIALYCKHGFAIEGVKRRARKIDGRYDDLVQMALLLLPSIE